MSEILELPEHTTQLIDEPDADSLLYLLSANTSSGLETKVVDVRGESPNAFPPRTVSPRTVTDVASFHAELTRRQLIDKVSTLWGNRKAGEVTAVYDELAPDAGDDYTRRADRLILKFVPDPDWATFRKAADGGYHDQEEFGDLIESAGHLITSHPAAELMEIVDSVRASKSGSFESKIRRDTGGQHLTYSQETTATAGSAQKPLEVPREVTFTARPFEDYPQIDIKCWLRIRISQGQLFLGLFPQPHEHLVRAAWLHVVNQVSEPLGVPVYAANLTA